MRGHSSVGCITDHRNARIKDTSCGWRRMEAFLKEARAKKGL
jgi:hypothetical protein